MKRENFNYTKVYINHTNNVPENGTVLEKFIFWFRDFLNNSE